MKTIIMFFVLLFFSLCLIVSVFQFIKSMFYHKQKTIWLKNIAISLVFVVGSILYIGANSESSTQNAPNKPTVVSQENVSSSKSSSNETDFMKENEKLQKEMIPHREEMKNAMSSVLKGYDVKINTPSLYSRDVFSLDCEINIGSDSKDEARSAGVDVINKLRNTQFPYAVDSYSVIAMYKKSPIGMVIYSPDFDKYTFVANGKRETFQP